MADQEWGIGDTIGVILVILIIAGVGALISGFISYDCGYRDGQSNALDGSWNYARVEINGEVQHVRLKQPTTNPVGIVR